MDWSLTYWGLDEMVAILQMKFSGAFSWQKTYEFRIIFHQFFFRINTIQALAQIMAWHGPDGKPSSEPISVSLLALICVTRPQWFNEVFKFPEGVSDDRICYRLHYSFIITLGPRQNGHHFAGDIFKCIFWMKMYEFWLIQIMVWRLSGDKPLSESINVG